MQRCNPILREIDHRDDLPDFLHRHNLIGEIAEVGTFTGNYAVALAKYRGTVACIDPYAKFPKSVYFDSTQDANQEETYRHTVARLSPFKNVRVIRKTSRDAAADFADGSLKAVHIDSNHSFDATTEDIELWWPKVCSGGIFSLHDCNTRQRDTNSDSLNAILDLAERLDVRPHICWCTSAFFLKP